MNSKLAPSYLNDHFRPVMNIHEKNTRFRVKIGSTNNNSNTVLENNKRFFIPKVRGFGMKSFAYNGCTLWNALPQNDAKDMPKLCHLLKTSPMNIFLILCKCALVNLFYTYTVYTEYSSY